ncbi:DUF2523 family protein [Stutzerimonas kunmingensis]|uniref:DUF2523 family protein n=1 Tax=Stutzerimonas kunmingensis TaxID=1211807 RepID=UPI0028A5B2FF|nr:DUF2523 family protein [Stutzerimonas kunmingensis]
MSGLFQWLLDTFAKFVDWLLELVLWAPKKILEALLDALAGVLEAIPVPSFMSNAQSFFSAIPSEVVFVLTFFAVKEGVAMIIAALILRFILRRIPIIG